MSVTRRTKTVATAATMAVVSAAGLTGASGTAVASTASSAGSQPGHNCYVTKLLLRSNHIPLGDTPDSASPRDPNLDSFSGAPSANRLQAIAPSAKYRLAMSAYAELHCEEFTEWRMTLQLRRRKSGPDKVVDERKIDGKGFHKFSVGADCKRGQRFNADFYLTVLGNPLQHNNVKNIPCK